LIGLFLYEIAPVSKDYLISCKNGSAIQHYWHSFEEMPSINRPSDFSSSKSSIVLIQKSPTERFGFDGSH